MKRGCRNNQFDSLADFSAFFKKVMAESDNFVVYFKIACKRLGDVVILWK